jgi:hypothetical protein
MAALMNTFSEPGVVKVRCATRILHAGGAIWR